MNLDSKVLKIINSFAKGQVWRGELAILFSTWLIWLDLVVIGLWLWQGDMATKKILVVYLLLSLILSVGVSYIIKNLVDRPRPFIKSKRITLLIGKKEPYLSFPSSHTAVVVALLVGLLMIDKFVPVPWGLRLFAGLNVLLVPLGRIMVGVHYPADVLAGGFVGWLCAYGLAWLMLT